MSIEMRNKMKVLEAEKSRLAEQMTLLAAEITDIKRRLEEVERPLTGLLADLSKTWIAPQRRGRRPKNVE
jgi:predicted nuclease with TOPRIM domain